MSVSRNEVFNGVKGDCILNYLKYFNVVESHCIDYMHSVLEGVIKTFFNYWFNSKLSCDYSLASKMQEIDNRLLNIKPPKYIPSTPRSIYTHNLWRAHEFSTFLLFYAAPVLNGLMKEIYYENIKKLVIIMENLLLPVINKNSLKNVENLIFEFLQEVEIIYAKNIMLSGAHELTHLVDCAISFGPLNSVNLFPFEELNRKLLFFTNGFDLIGEEILKIFSTCKFILKYTSKIENHEIKKFIESHLTIKSSNKKNVNKLKKIICLGKCEEKDKDQYLSSFKIFDFTYLTNSFRLYTKIIYNGIYYCSHLIATKRCDSCFVSSSGQSGLIEKFITDENEKLYVLAKKIIKIRDTPFFSSSFPNLRSQLYICIISDTFFIEEIKNINKTFLIKIANNRHFLSCFNISHLFN